MAMSRVPGDDELYISGVFTLRRPTLLKENNITHIVSVLRNFAPSPKNPQTLIDPKIPGNSTTPTKSDDSGDSSRGFKEWDKYEHLCIEVDDAEDENLLVHFEDSGAWIERALKAGGGVLVHCAMGKSRSATIILAYLLRKSYRQTQTTSSDPSNPISPLTSGISSLAISPNDNPLYSSPHTVTSALSLLRQTRPIAEPNEGFMKQLELYADMGCPMDIERDPKYQRWVYALEVEEAVACGRAPDRVRFEDEIEGETEAGAKEEPASTENVELRCRKCRKTLATTPYILHHTPKSPAPTSLSPYAPISSLPSASPTACRQHHLAPLSWMRPLLSQGLLSGRLDCPNPKCGAQIGRYSWQGMQCTCAVWVIPAFFLATGKVDEIIKNPVTRQKDGGGMGIRMPPGMREKI